MTVSLDDAAAALEELVSDFAEQHRQLLKDLQLDEVAAVKEENEHLKNEVQRLRSQAGRSKAARTPPPLPWLPKRPPDSSMHTLSTGSPLFRSADDGLRSDLFPSAEEARRPEDLRAAGRETFVNESALTANLPGMVFEMPTLLDASALDDLQSKPPSEQSEFKVSEDDLARLRRILNLGLGDCDDTPDDLEEVTPAVLAAAVNRRVASTPSFGDPIDASAAAEVLHQLRIARWQAGDGIRSTCSHRHLEDAPCGMPFLEFSTLVYNDVLEELINCNPRERALVLRVTEALRQVTIGEIVGAATHNVGHVQERHQHRSWVAMLNTVVFVAVATDIICMAVSADVNPDAFQWLILETVCTLIFVAEVVIKLRVLGASAYFCGQGFEWNYCDLAITTISVAEVGMNYVEKFSSGDREPGVMAAARVAVLLRGLRIIRVVRMVKLVSNPMLKDLANMLVGFIIGMPSLFWVLIFFLLVLFMIGLTFRFMFGPSRGQDLLSQCGYPDDMVDFDDPLCKISYMYGEEFFRSVPQAMFTTFRFMLGDYGTRGGKSLVVALAQDYGVKFQLLFVTWMIISIFGLFNIITAIFVDTTVAGLKHNDVKRKYIRQYERMYVAGKLTELLERARTMALAQRSTLNHHRSLSSTGKNDGSCTRQVEMNEDTFVMIMEDPAVKQLLSDLDIDMFNPAGMFFTFDGEGNGSLSLQELAKGIMKLRGDLQKCDLIASWVASRSLHDKFDALKEQLDKVMQQRGGLSRRPSRIFTGDARLGSRPGSRLATPRAPQKPPWSA